MRTAERKKTLAVCSRTLEHVICTQFQFQFRRRSSMGIDRVVTHSARFGSHREAVLEHHAAAQPGRIRVCRVRQVPATLGTIVASPSAASGTVLWLHVWQAWAWQRVQEGAAPGAAGRTQWRRHAVDCSGFVHQGKLNALSQYNHLIFAPSLVDEKECIERMVRSTPVTPRCAAATVSTCWSNLCVCALARVCALAVNVRACERACVSACAVCAA